MSQTLLERALARARRHRAAEVAALALPWLAAAAAVAWRIVGPDAAALVAAAMAVVAAGVAWRRVAALDRGWLVRTMDARDPQLEDSTALAFAAGATLGRLQRVQRARLLERLSRAPAPDLRTPWRWRPLVASWVLALAVLVLAVAWPRQDVAGAVIRGAAPQPARGTGSATEIGLVSSTLTVDPPAYTRLPRREVAGLDARVPEGARVRWRLRLAPDPPSAALVFHDGRTVALERDGAHWMGASRVDRAGLYRIVPGGPLPLVPDRLSRLDVARDLPPKITVTAPEATLTLRGSGQQRWPLVFEASDDHGLQPAATLRITTARGSGENITFEEQARTLRGSGDRRRLRFATSIDLAPVALQPGEDLVVQFEVRDNRAGAPQSTRSASYILRAPPPEAMLESALEGLVKTTLPAYFRSQRQIIIDAEALIQERPRLSDATFLERSDAIGVDQRLLRLRYGQFLGEETEGAPRRRLMPTNDAEDEAEEARRAADGVAAGADPGAGHAEDAQGGDGRPDVGPTADEPAGDAHADDAHATASGPGDHDHDGEPPSPPATFGSALDVLEEFGHTHDHAEAATLLDPETRATLKQALDQMWQSELELRQARPDAALPFANKALDLIKQVQQADRIYLARVGYEQAPVDHARRLTGKRDGIASRRVAMFAAPPPGAAPDALWQALQSQGADNVEAALQEFERWLGNAGDEVRDPLALVAAIDAARADPACAACRARLRALLWPLLRGPVPVPPRRAGADRAGRAYLDALQQEDAP